MVLPPVLLKSAFLPPESRRWRTPLGAQWRGQSLCGCPPEWLAAKEAPQGLPALWWPIMRPSVAFCLVRNDAGHLNAESSSVFDTSFTFLL